MCVLNTLLINILIFVVKVLKFFFSSKYQGRAKQNKQDDDIPEGSSLPFSFPVNAFPAFHLARKLLLIVGSILSIAPRTATVLHYSTIRAALAHLHVF